ncbi:hypothetical protein F8564_11645 [Serratia sp. RJAL6]|nr:hypothetical protein F8564_11645 [Enterobacter sp. RJAL6]
MDMSNKRRLISLVNEYVAEDILYSYYCLLSTVFLWVLGYFLLLYDVPFYLKVVGVCVAAALNVRFFVLYHDYCHRALFQRRNRVVDVIFSLFGLFIFFPKAQWVSSHDEHHSTNSIVNLGSESMFGNYLSGYFMVLDKKHWQALPPRKRWLYRFRRSPLAIMCGLPVFFVLPSMVKGMLEARTCWASFVSLLIQTSILVVVFQWGGWTLVAFYLSPLFIATAVGSYLFYVQHNFPQAKLYNRSQWDYIDAAMKSTSYFKMGPLMSWVTGNIGYHHIHHINHRIPFYNLPKAMENILVLNEVEVTRWCFADIHANFACNLWDEEGETFIRYNALR